MACTPAPSSAPANVEDLTSLILSIVPFSAFAHLPDWVKLAIIGTVLETVRRTFFRLWSYILSHFTLTAHFDSSDTSYDWVMFWLSQQPTFRKARDIEISTRAWGSRPNGYLVPGEEPEFDDGGLPARELAYVPSPAMTYSLWYKRRYMTVTRIRRETGNSWRSETEDSLEISITTSDRGIMNALLLEAKRAYNASQETMVNVYVSDDYNDYWRCVASPPKRALNSIVLDPGLAETVLADARDFLSSRAWYAKRGIPFRRGYLLYGAPGSGKTSLIHSIAGELGLSVYIVSLSQAGMDDTRLAKLIADLPERCIALMEDIDAALHHGISRDMSGTDTESDDGEGSRERQGGKGKGGDAPAPATRITLSGLLNALDGIGAQEGRILFATTNRYGALDAALCRPGRMDIHVEFRLASRYQAGELFKCFYMPDDEGDEGEERDPEREEESDSGYASVAGESETEMKAEGVVGVMHGVRGPSLTRTQVLALAKRFADALPERGLSMATLQGYLMMYKIRPVEAVEKVERWVVKELGEKEKEREQKEATDASTPDTPATSLVDTCSDTCSSSA